LFRKPNVHWTDHALHDIPPAKELSFLQVPGEMAGRIRQLQWERTPLGPPAAWDVPLKTLVGLMLSATQPMFMFWGAEKTWLYNDAFIPILGDKHPGALGQPALEVWSEAREALEPLFSTVLSGEPVHMRDFRIMLDRQGRLEEAYFNYSYTPARDGMGFVAGLFGVCTETTEEVRHGRRIVADRERQRRQFEQAPGFVIIMRGRDHVVEFLNNEHRRLFASDDWIGKPIREAFPSIADQGFFELLDRVLETGQPFRAEAAQVRFQRSPEAEEQLRYLDFIYAPLTDDDGRVSGIFCAGFDVTDRRRSQEVIDAAQAELRRLNESLAASEWTLRERESELAQVQRIAQVGGVVVDIRDGFHNRRSPEYLAIHGLPASAVNETHEDWVQRIHPEDRGRAERQFLEALNGAGDRYSSEYRIVRPDTGQTRWIVAEGRFERGPDGKALRMIGAHIDITERARSRALLRESEERFRLIANSAPVPMWVSRLDRSRAFANQAYVEFLGMGYDEALAFDWRRILHPDDMERIIGESIAGEASRRPFTLEARYRRADGAWRWIRSESQPRWGPAGELVGFIGVAHDVTVAKQAEIELRSLNETLERRIGERTSQLQSILETTNQYQGLLDARGNLVYANATALAGIRAKAAAVLGKPFWDSPWFAGAEAARAVVSSAFSAARDGEGARTEIRLHLPSGERYFDFAMRPILDQLGAITSILWEAVDITERRQNEEALRQAQKMEAVGQLTGGVAHDFNNLLTIIRSATDFLRRRGLSEERRRRYIDAISDTADRASKLTAQLLAFARRQPLVPEVFNVGAKVERVAQLIRPLVGGRIKIDLQLCHPECFANADVAQFETTMVNLAVNARDAMDGEGHLSISIATADAIPPVRGNSGRRGDFVSVTVTDTGTGISPVNLDAIFEPFFTTKEVGKGTGLGLSQAFGFAKQSGGEIAVESVLGTGTTFTIYLPQAEPPSDGTRPIAARIESSSAGRGNRILVVEDNEEVGRFSTELLTDLGYVIKWVTNAKDALEALAKDDLAFDLVFSDVIMPGMNGVELAATVRERFPGLPVVLTSGYSDVLAQNADRGFDLIQKPYSVETLSRALRKAILELQHIR
jgi:PAS domain S-box-containing protein